MRRWLTKPMERARPAGRVAARHAARVTGQLERELARTLAGRLGSVADRHMEAAMLTPARRPVLDALFWGLPHVLDGSAAHELASSVRFQVLDYAGATSESYWLAYEAGRWRRGRGQPEQAKLTITARGPLLVALAYGRASPTREYLAGRLRVRGNPRTAARFLSIVRARLTEPGVSRGRAARAESEARSQSAPV